MGNQNSFLSTFRELWSLQILQLSGGTVTIGSIIIGLSALLVGLIIAKIVSRRLAGAIDRRMVLEKSVRYLLEKLFFYFFALLSSLFALKFAHIPLTVFTVMGGAIAIGVGFGSQNLVNNFLSGLILMIERPLKVGDFVEVEHLFGEVEEIGMRSTSILTYGNKHIIVPNSSFLEKNVLNWTRKDKFIRISINVGVIYGSDTEKVEQLLIDAVKSDEQVLSSPSKEPEVFFTKFGDNSLEFEVCFWIKLLNLIDRRRVESRLRFVIDRLFRANNLVIAFPQRDVHLYSKDPISVKISP